MISLTPFSQLIYYFSLIGLPFIYLYLVILLVLQSENQKPSLISNLGKYTYGMYLYHPIIIIFVKIIFDLMGIDYQRNIITNLILAIVSLIVTIFISFVSYEYFEKHILKFKDRFSFVKTRI
jgi:peptidoglycan/LPS O-acetylase OafA/YrhL